MNQDEHFMRKALLAAKQGLELGNPPFGCCIVYSDKYVTAYNTTFIEHDSTKHAEINALQKLFQMGKNFSNVTLYSTVEPCLMCMGAIGWSKITKIVYGTSMNSSKKNGFNEFLISSCELKKYFPYDLVIESGVLEKECEDIFVQWSRKNKLLKWMQSQA